MKNELLLLSNNDIPFAEAQITIHVPSIREIALIGEEDFFAGCRFLNFSKNLLSEKDKVNLEDKTDFDIFMSIMCSEEKLPIKDSVMMVLSLLFPDYQVKFFDRDLILFSEKNTTRINNTNYDIFKDILVHMFGLNDQNSGISQDYNPADKRAEKIAEKLREAKKKKNQREGKVEKVAIYSRYISVLAVGEHKDINELMEYNVFQLLDEFNRFQKKFDFDIYLKAKMAGAKDLDEIENWMGDMHPS